MEHLRYSPEPEGHFTGISGYFNRLNLQIHMLLDRFTPSPKPPPSQMMLILTLLAFSLTLGGIFLSWLLRTLRCSERIRVLPLPPVAYELHKRSRCRSLLLSKANSVCAPHESNAQPMASSAEMVSEHGEKPELNVQQMSQVREELEDTISTISNESRSSASSIETAIHCIHWGSKKALRSEPDVAPKTPRIDKGTPTAASPQPVPSLPETYLMLLGDDTPAIERAQPKLPCYTSPKVPRNSKAPPEPGPKRIWSKWPTKAVPKPKFDYRLRLSANHLPVSCSPASPRELKAAPEPVAEPARPKSPPKVVPVPPFDFRPYSTLPMNQLPESGSPKAPCDLKATSEPVAEPARPKLPPKVTPKPKFDFRPRFPGNQLPVLGSPKTPRDFKAAPKPVAEPAVPKAADIKPCYTLPVIDSNTVVPNITHILPRLCGTVKYVEERSPLTVIRKRKVTKCTQTRPCVLQLVDMGKPYFNPTGDPNPFVNAVLYDRGMLHKMAKNSRLPRPAHGPRSPFAPSSSSA